MKQLAVAASIAAFACLTPGLALALTDTEPLTMVYEEAPAPAARPNGPPPQQRIAMVQACTMYLPKIADARTNPSYAGNSTFILASMGASPLFVQSAKSGDGVAWTRGALTSSFKSYGFRVAEGAPATAEEPRKVAANVSLRLAHAWSAGLNLVSHVVLNVSYATPGGEITRQYHGMGTRINWNGGNGEYMAVLNLGMDEALRTFATDAALLCDGKAIDPS